MGAATSRSPSRPYHRGSLTHLQLERLLTDNPEGLADLVHLRVPEPVATNCGREVLAGTEFTDRAPNTSSPASTRSTACFICSGACVGVGMRALLLNRHRQPSPQHLAHLTAHEVVHRARRRPGSRCAGAPLGMLLRGEVDRPQTDGDLRAVDRFADLENWQPYFLCSRRMCRSLLAKCRAMLHQPRSRSSPIRAAHWYSFRPRDPLGPPQGQPRQGLGFSPAHGAGSHDEDLTPGVGSRLAHTSTRSLMPCHQRCVASRSYTRPISSNAFVHADPRSGDDFT
jgi:hypothetical protein